MSFESEFSARFGPILFAERERRADAFLDPPGEIAGEAIAPLTLQHWALLDAIRSPLLIASDFHDADGIAYLRDVLPLFPDELARSLWVMSAEYARVSHCAGELDRSIQWHQTEFIRRMAAALADPGAIKEAVELAIDHVRDAFADTPAGSGKPGVPLASHLAYLVHGIATQYHWTEPYILHELPLNRLWQYLRLIEKANDPNHIATNPSDQAKGEIFAELQEAAQAEKAAEQEDPPAPSHRQNSPETN